MLTKFSDLTALLSGFSLEDLTTAASYPLHKASAESAWTPEGQRRRGTSRWRAFLRALSGSGPSEPSAWLSPGAVQYVQINERGAVLEVENGCLDITFLAPDLVCIKFRSHGADAPEAPLPYSIAKPEDAWSVPEISSIQLKETLMLHTNGLLVGVHLDAARVFIATPDGDVLRADIDTAWSPDGQLRHRVALAEREKLFGLGERATPWNRRGRTHTLWNTDPAGYANGDDPINLNIPVYVGAVPGTDGGLRSYLVFYENPHYATFDLGNSNADVADHRFAGGELRYYFAAGTLPDLAERYTELTGRHALQPLWMLGYQQSRWSYKTDTRVRKLAQDFRNHRVPCDAIHIDIDYMDGFRCFTWNRDRFPDPAQLATDLREQGVKLITILDPGIKRDPDYAVYREGIEGGHFCTLPNGTVFHAPVWPGDSAFPDFTAPAARSWWGHLYADLVELGIAGFWNDMNEPAAFASSGDPTLPVTLRHALEGRGGNHREAHNVYGLLMARASREGLEALRPDTRPVVITRAGWAGVQRYATSWTADNESTWEALALTVPMVMGLGLSGVGFTGPDVGGFIGEADGELFTRWVQMAAFMPFFRAHTAKGTPDQEPWSYGEPYLSVVRRFIELRYELLPYLYTALWQMCTRGWPMVRPLAWADPSTETLWNVDDAFLCGDALLVAPVLASGTVERLVSLPTGAWYEFWNNRLHPGGQTITQFAPLETLPLLVREGTVLPLGEIGPSVEQRKDKFLRLSIYPRSTPGVSVSELYEDAGEGLNYQDGEARLSRFILEQSETDLTLTWESAGDYAPPYEHIELTLNGLDRMPQQVLADDEVYEILKTDTVRRCVVLAVPSFRRLKVAL